MIAMSIKMLWTERKSAKNLYYSITSAFVVVVLFIQISSNHQVIPEIGYWDIILKNDNYLAMLLTLLIAIVCGTLVSYSCNYYGRTHSRQLGLVKLAGFTDIQAAMYQLLQIIVVIVCSTITALIISRLIQPILMWTIYQYMGVNQNILYYSIDGLGVSIAILITLSIVIVGVSLQYSIRGKIINLLKSRTIVGFQRDTRVIKMPNEGYILAYIIGIYTMYAGSDFTPGFMISSCIGVVGAYGIFYYVLPYTIQKILDTGKLKSENYVILGDMSLFLQQVKTLITFIMISFICLSTIVLIGDTKISLHVIGNSAAILINILLGITLVNRFKIDDFEKRQHYQVIKKIGFTIKEVKLISRKQAIYFYIILLLIMNIYLVNILLVFYIKLELDIPLAIFVFITSNIPYLLSMVVVLMNKKEIIE